MAERARLERDGDLGILVIDDPPLNLFGDEMVRDIQGALDATDGLHALLVRAEGEYFTGGADVHVFEGLTRGQAEELTAALREIRSPDRGPALPDARLGARAVPHYRA